MTLFDIDVSLGSKVFLIYGEEQYHIHRLLEYINTRYDNNDIRRYEGSILDMHRLRDDILQQSFFSSQRVFIIDNLQACKAIEKQDTLEALSMILKAIDNDSKVFFIYRKKLLRTNGLLKLFARYYIYESKPLTEQQTMGYISEICKDRNINLSSEARGVIYHLLGNDLTKISSALVGLDGLDIDSDYIIRHVAYDKTFNGFELMAAIAKRDTNKICLMTTQLLDHMSLSEIIPLLGLLYSFFTKVLLLKVCGRMENNSILYITAAKNYGIADITEAISIIQKCDERIKGL